MRWFLKIERPYLILKDFIQGEFVKQLYAGILALSCVCAAGADVMTDHMASKLSSTSTFTDESQFNLWDFNQNALGFVDSRKAVTTLSAGYRRLSWRNEDMIACDCK